MESVISTWGGGSFNITDPKPDMVKIEDIAKSLSCLCRYTGHCNDFYSVAQHSILMANLTEFNGMGTPLQRLFHDSAEAYIGDISTPLKRILLVDPLHFGDTRPGRSYQKIRTVEKRILKVIGQALGVKLPDKDAYVPADQIMMATEVRDLMNPKSRELFADQLQGITPLNYPLSPWEWKAAYELFLQSYNELKEREKNEHEPEAKGRDVA